MDYMRMVGELRAERDQINQAIAVFERLARGAGSSVFPKRRGRPLGSKNKPKPPKTATPDGTTRLRLSATGS